MAVRTTMTAATIMTVTTAATITGATATTTTAATATVTVDKRTADSVFGVRATRFSLPV